MRGTRPQIRGTSKRSSVRRPARKTAPVTWEVVRQLALALPGVEAGFSYRTAAFRVRGKLLVRLREDGESVVIKIDFDERDLLMAANPETFYITDHYRNYPAMLVRLATVSREEQIGRA